MRNLLLLLVLLPVAASAAAGTPQTIIEPPADRWMYPSNATPGTRSQASTFSALPGAAGFDDRWAFFLIAFDTGDAVPAGLPAQYYRVRSMKVTAMIAQDELFAYDPSDDGWSTYALPGVPATTPDADAGRPLELHGAGFRGGFNAATFQETSAYGGGSQPGTRNAYPLGFSPGGSARDVSNNVTGQFDAAPWAVGTSPGLNPGEPVPEGTLMSFVIDGTLPGVDAYLREGLAAGRIWFSLSSLHPALLQAGEFVSYHTRDSFAHRDSMENEPSYLGGIAPTLELEVEIQLPLGITREGDAITLNWPQFAGLTFSLQASPDMSAGSWQQIHKQQATSSETGHHSELFQPGRRFYRLAITPTP